MVKRLRSEGYWVRGVDLKSPEFSKTEANEFVQGDLRDVHFVKRVLEFKGYSGNFSTDGSGSFFSPSFPCSFRPEDVMVTRNPNRNTVVTIIREI